MRSALAWKRFYEHERARMGVAGLDALLDRAASMDVPRAADAWIVPHARATECGHQVALVASRVVEARVDRVLALGVLHGARERDAELVARAKAGDVDARRALRGVHRVDDHAAEEFSLDLFLALLDRASARANVAPPEVIARYPFLVGHDPSDLPGLDELRSLREGGCAVVATTDPLHHGAGYGTPPSEQRDRTASATIGFARARIEAQLGALARHDHEAFLVEAERARSDFRDVGPVLATLLAGRSVHYAIDDLVLVDYAAVLDAPQPTWVAAALIHADRSSSAPSR